MTDWQQDFTPSQQHVSPVQNWQQDFTPYSQQDVNTNNQDANYVGSILPFSNDAQGNTHFDINAGIPGAAIKGIKDLMSMESYPSTSSTEEGGKLSSDAISDLIGITGLTFSRRASIPTLETAPPPDISPPSSAILPKYSDIKLIKQKLDLAGITPQQYADALANSSSEDFAGEVGGDPLRMQTQAQAKITGPEMQDARDAMRERLATSPQRTAQIIGENIKPAENVQRMLENIQDMQRQLPDLYEAAYQRTAPSSIVSDIVSRPAGQQAISETVEKLSNQGINPLEAGLVKGSNGTWRFTTDVPVKTIDEFQRSLGDLVTRNPITGAVEGSDAATIESMRKNVTSDLGKSSPEYQKALNVAAAKQQAESAFEMGRQLAKSAAGEKADAIMERASEVMSPNELSYQRAGYAQGLTDASQGAALGSGGEASRIATGKVQNSVGSILDSPTASQKFADALMQEKNRIDLAQRGLGGSNTAETLDAGLPKIPNLMELPSHAVNLAKNWLMHSRNERLAQLLYATSPEQKSILAQKILEK